MAFTFWNSLLEGAKLSREIESSEEDHLGVSLYTPWGWHFRGCEVAVEAERKIK